MSIVNFENGVCALTDTGLVRPHNEDSNRLESTSNGELFVVCDGMGGHVGGATASWIGVDSICKYVQEHECAIPQQFLTKALEYANEQIYAASRSNPQLRGMGTTACVALVRKDIVWYAHVGDSRIYYYNFAKKMLFRLTKDHSVVQSLVDQGMITEAEAEHHPEKNKIRKSLGIKAEVEPEPCQIPLRPADGDILLICSDGLSGMMDDDDILGVLSSQADINEAGKSLMELAKAGGGTDNITVQLVRFSNTNVKEAVYDAKNSGVGGNVQQVKPKEKQIWPWVVITLSSILLIFVCVLFFWSSEDTKGVDVKVESVTTNEVKKDAYLELRIVQEYVKDKKNPYAYKDKNDNFVYSVYIENKFPNGLIKGVRVNEETKTYEIGTFTEKNLKTEEGKGVLYYIPREITKYERDGSLKVQ